VYGLFKEPVINWKVQRLLKIMHVIRVWWIGKDVDRSCRRSWPHLGL